MGFSLSSSARRPEIGRVNKARITAGPFRSRRPARCNTGRAVKAKALAWGDPLSWRCIAKAEEITSRAQLYSQNLFRFRAFMSRWKWFLCASLAAGPSVVPNTSQASSCTVLMKTL